MEPLDTLIRLREVARGRPLFVWGAGSAGVRATRYLRDQKIEPAGFIDSNARENWRVEGLPVHPPSHARDLHQAGRAPFVVVASIHAAAIVESANALGLTAPDSVAVLTTPPEEFPGVVDPLVPDFYALLHQLRTHALADMPQGAKTMLSPGCSGKWYFDWVEQTYAHVPRHIGAEIFLDKPADLPPNVEWLARDTASIPEVRDNEIDLAFSGQNIEHLWPDQVKGFLLETHRVLAPGGWLVLDSPNRELTKPLIWSHGEHTIEYSIPDVRELLDVAGFGDIAIRGIWLTRDRGRLLPLSPFEKGAPDAMEVLRRAALARNRPEDSFVWWAEARKRHAPRVAELDAVLARMFAAAWPERLNRFVVPGPVRDDASGRWARLGAGERGIVAEGPLFPLRRGRHTLRYRFRGDGGAPCKVRLELTRGVGAQETSLASIAAESAGDGVLEAVVPLTDDMTFAFRTRLFNDGGGAGELLLDCRHDAGDI